MEKSLNLSAGMNCHPVALLTCSCRTKWYPLCTLYAVYEAVLCASCDNKQPGTEQVVYAVTHAHVIWWWRNVWWTEATLSTHRKGSVGSLCSDFCWLLSGIHLKWRLQSNPVTQKSFCVSIWHASWQFTYCSVETSYKFIYYQYCIL